MLALESIIVGIGATLITGLFGYFGIVKKSSTDEVAIALDAWKEMVDSLKTELRETKEEIIKLRSELEINEKRHKKEIDDLQVQMKRRIKKPPSA